MLGAQGAEVLGTTLLERGEELHCIDEALTAARAGSGTLVLVEGPAGIGKTELLTEARRRAEGSGMTVASARGSELERELAYGVARQLFEPAVARQDSSAGTELLSGSAALAEPLFLPEAASSNARFDGKEDMFAVLHGLYWLCANLAQHEPLLVAVDDAHWADLASLRFLAYLAHRREGLPLALIVTARPAETPAEEELLARLAAEPGAIALAPQPLSRDAVAAVLGSELDESPEPPFVDACRTATGGIPFLLRELLHELLTERIAPVAANAEHVGDLGPRTIARAVVARVRRIGNGALELARAAAVLGADAETSRAARLAAIDQVAAVDALDGLAAAAVIRRTRPIEFVHPIVRSAVYGDIPPGERGRLHTMAATLLAREGTPEERVAAHLLATYPSGDPHTVDLLLRTARVALGRGAPDSATTYLERALAEPPTGEMLVQVLHDLGRAEISHGRYRGFVQHMERAMAVCADPDRRAHIALDLGRGLSSIGDIRQGLAAYELVLGALADPDSPLALHAEAELYTLGTTGDYATAEAIFDRGIARLGQLDRIEHEAPALLGPLGKVHAMLFPPAAVGTAIVERARLLEQPALNTAVPAAGAKAFQYAGKLARGGELYDRFIADARSRGALMTVGWASALRSEITRYQGMLARAEGEARLGFDLLKEAATAGSSVTDTGGRPTGGFAWMSAMLIEALLARGGMDDAAQVLATVEPLDQFEPSFPASLLVAARGRLRLALGDAEGALADALASALPFGEYRAARGECNPALRPWRSDAAWALRALDRKEEGRELGETELALAREFEVAHAVGQALRAVAACSCRDEAIELLTEAVTVLEASEARLELAHALVDLGAALRRASRRRDCQPPLRRGLDLAHRCGAAGLAARAREELLATGARPRREVLSGVEALTPSERRVAELAAEGMTNREIAQALFVTARTVEGHLTHVYQKLDIESRDQLGEELAAEA